jgi:hypothetical protein
MLRRSFHICRNCRQNLLAWSQGRFKIPTLNVNTEEKPRAVRAVQTLYFTEQDNKNHEYWNKFYRLISIGQLDKARSTLKAWSEQLPEEMILAGFEALVFRKTPVEKIKDIQWLLNLPGIKKFPVRLVALFLHEACENERTTQNGQADTKESDILYILDEVKQQQISSREILKYEDVLTQSDIQLIEKVSGSDTANSL